jgi:hypothetical protein
VRLAVRGEPPLQHGTEVLGKTALLPWAARRLVRALAMVTMGQKDRAAAAREADSQLHLQAQRLVALEVALAFTHLTLWILMAIQKFILQLLLVQVERVEPAQDLANLVVTGEMARLIIKSKPQALSRFI